MLKNKSGGFSLIELTIVLAITTAVAAIVLAGQNGIRDQSEFTSTVNSVVSQLTAVRNAAETSDNLNDTTTCNTSTSCIVYGKMITTAQKDTKITISDIIGTGDQTQSCESLETGGEGLTIGKTTTISIPDGIQVKALLENPDVQVVYHRSLCGGQLLTYDFSGLDAGVPLEQAQYNEAADPSIINATTPLFHLLDPRTGQVAAINIDGANNGSITATYND
jgi:type II secretory pathway pseudopilin PulG